MYTITNGIIQEPGIWQGPSPNSGGPLVDPTLLVMHYTGSGGVDGNGDVSYLKNPAAKASAHCVVGRAGDVHQIVAFNRVAWHAGVSSWQGRSGCNGFSIGIEIDNWGYCMQRADFKFVPGASPKTVLQPDQVIRAKHKYPAWTWDYWEIYNQAQIEAVIALTNSILAAYPTIKDIQGHDDIAPGRKADPGPAFPWNHVRNETIGRRQNNTDDLRIVTASALNVREGPSTQHRAVDQVQKGQEVRVIYDVPGDWAQIEYAGGQGYVSETYLRRK